MGWGAVQVALERCPVCTFTATWVLVICLKLYHVALAKQALQELYVGAVLLPRHCY